MRLSRLMSMRGLCSRREADRLIQLGQVQVDGIAVTELGTRVSPDCRISVSPSAQSDQRQRVTILLNKPVGYVSAQPERGYLPATSLISRHNQYRGDRSALRYRPRHRHNLAPAGRLDIDSQGLLVLTQDGRIARRLIGPGAAVEKEYLVRVQGELTETTLQGLRGTLSLDGHQLKPVRVEQVNTEQLQFVLIEGRKRQIRRMCAMVGLAVTGLKRVRIGAVTLGALPEGQWRYLGRRERF